MSDTGLEPANADDTASTEAAQVDTEAAAVEGADPAPAAAETGKPERDKVQERFDKLTREKYEGLSRAERAEYRAQELERRLAEIETRQAASNETVAPSDEYPTLESCGFDEAKYRIALDAYYDKKFEAKAEGVLTKREQAMQQAQAEREWARREQEFVKVTPDYREKVYRHPHEGGPSITEEMAAAAKRRGSGAEVFYYLGNNPEKSYEIARMHPTDQAIEIGRIEARLEAAKAAPPHVSKAPPPAPKLDAAAATDDSEPNASWSDERWEKWRRRQISQRG